MFDISSIAGSRLPARATRALFPAAIGAVLLAAAPGADNRRNLVRDAFPRLVDPSVIASGSAIPGEYVIYFGDGIGGPELIGPTVDANAVADAVRRSDAAEQMIEGRRDGSALLSRYRAVLVGFSARLTPAALVDIQRLPDARVEPNVAIEVPDPGYSGPPAAPVSPGATMRTASAPPFPAGLDRIDRRLLPPDTSFQTNSHGAGVHVYVIDTGVNGDHGEFGGRVGLGYNATKDGKGTADCRDHGTAVASIIGGNTMGVASQVIIHPVRVFPCQGLTSSTVVFLDGVEWVAKDRVKIRKSPALANISFKLVLAGSGGALDAAIANSIDKANIPYVIAAGNDGADACQYSPAHVPHAITVGNVSPDSDRRKLDSNYGKCIDIFAPGVNILAAGVTGPSDWGTRSGTSFAAPHVSGVAALFLNTNPAANPAVIWAAILLAADNKDSASPTPLWCGIPNRMTGSPNVMLHWGSGSANGVYDGPLPPHAPPPPSCSNTARDKAR
ncbi:MAG: aqualysin 1 [Sphingomonadales bacterium]|jgi:hypothetical protein|nr:aqualysin 1 [Sphingomonadales bacterium]